MTVTPNADAAVLAAPVVVDGTMTVNSAGNSMVLSGGTVTVPSEAS